MATCSKAMVVSSTLWSAGFSQLMVFCCWCSTRRSAASPALSSESSDTRAKAWEKTDASFSMPFMRMIRQRVKASTSCLRYGGSVTWLHVRIWRSSGMPRSSNGFMAMPLVPPRERMRGSLCKEGAARRDERFRACCAMFSNPPLGGPRGEIQGGDPDRTDVRRQDRLRARAGGAAPARRRDRGGRCQERGRLRGGRARGRRALRQGPPDHEEEH